MSHRHLNWLRRSCSLQARLEWLQGTSKQEALEVVLGGIRTALASVATTRRKKVERPAGCGPWPESDR